MDLHCTYSLARDELGVSSSPKTLAQLHGHFFTFEVAVDLDGLNHADDHAPRAACNQSHQSSHCNDVRQGHAPTRHDDMDLQS
eukprot:12403655-Karenia_brevis.AAC.1